MIAVNFKVVSLLLQEHLAKHAGDKPYKCEVCPKQFNHKTDLRRHMCLHTGEKPFACEVCGKGFIREDRMVKHSDTHKKKQPILMTWQQMQPEVVSNNTASTIQPSSSPATVATPIQLPSSPCWRPGRPPPTNVRTEAVMHGQLWNTQPIPGNQAVPGLYENCWDSILKILLQQKSCNTTSSFFPNCSVNQDNLLLL